MNAFARLLSIAALGAASFASGAAPVPAQSALPDVPNNLPCHDGVISRACPMGSLVSQRGLPLQSMFDGRRYEQLDQVLQALCTGGTRLPDGQPELIVFDSSFVSMFDAWKDWGRFGAKLEAWRAASPDSPAQALIETIYWQRYAWHGRGSGYAGKVPPEAWELFRERLAKASARLEESKAVASNCPLWHSLNIEVLVDSGAPRARLDAAYAEAVKAFPASQQVHFAMSRAMEAKWGGAPGEFERFARRAVDLSRRDEGSAIYARLFWFADCDCNRGVTFGRPGDPDWKLMKAGFEDLLQRYPDQVHNRNRFASYACRANDRETYARLRRELGDNIIDEQWPDSWKVDVCDRRMAKK